MTKVYQDSLELPAVKGRKVRVEFGASDLTSDAGAHLLRLVDRRIGLTDQLARRLPDDRVAGRCVHSLRDLLRQRIGSPATAARTRPARAGNTPMWPSMTTRA